MLVSPSSNRVYAQSAPALAAAELLAVGQRVLGGALANVEQATFGSVDYVTFDLAELSELARGWLSNLAATFALFGLEEDGRLLPLTLDRWDQLPSDLITIQKYSGKTNEAFTKLLLNVTLAASAFATERRPLSVLDPLCGRGTTLNQALSYGFHATGVEVDKKDFEAYALFIQRWVKDHRLKHNAVQGSVKGNPKLDLELGVTKERFKAGDTLRLTYVSADTHAIAQVFQPRSFDLIVTDAPYGVQHGAHSGPDTARKPQELLQTALPVWRGALRPGGAIGIAWNQLVLRRTELARMLQEAGLEVCEFPQTFEHRVDSSIARDLIVARLTSR
ncbi:MAG: SAM-dependent methyltransferase [Myxococcales bacterium]|nr:MAG: SAM-dependent methyltransferase [Myxococcales bacterium]